MYNEPLEPRKKSAYFDFHVLLLGEAASAHRYGGYDVLVRDTNVLLLYVCLSTWQEHILFLK